MVYDDFFYVTIPRIVILAPLEKIWLLISKVSMVSTIIVFDLERRWPKQVTRCFFPNITTARTHIRCASTSTKQHGACPGSNNNAMHVMDLVCIVPECGAAMSFQDLRTQWLRQ